MAETSSSKPTVEQKASNRPRYEAPRLQVMTEKEILNTFQITQSMAGWWTTGMC